MAHIFEGDSKKLNSPKRKKILPVHTILKKLRIQKGMTVIDYGCGIGYFTLPLLDYVTTTGEIIGVDIRKDMLEELKKHIEEQTENITLIESGTIQNKTIPQADLILIVTVLHEIESVNKFLEDCKKHLKNDGRIIIIDWQKKKSHIGPPTSHRLSKKEVLDALPSTMTITEHPINDQFYFIEVQ